MKKILITGGAGFIGSHLVKKLLDLGHHVTVMDNLYTGNKSNVLLFSKHHNYVFIEHDITIPFEGKYDEIYNLACSASPVQYQKDPVYTAKVSVLGIINVLDLALKTNAKVFHTSTSEVYGDPLVNMQYEKYWGNVNTIGIRSCYDEGKRMAETFCADYFRKYGVDVRVNRIFNTYGPNMLPDDGRVISNFIIQALSRKDITIYGDGKQTRSFQFVSDLIIGIIALMEMDKNLLHKSAYNYGLDFPVVNMGNPKEFTILELATKVIAKVPLCTSKIIYKPLPRDDPKQRKPDLTFAKKLINYTPLIELDEGLDQTIEYFKGKYF